MSDTLADLASWLPSDFLSGDLAHKPPYDFNSSCSTESESDDDDVIFPGLTHRFTRSVSLQERPKVPYPLEKKRVFSGSPESTLNWNVSGSAHVRSSPTTPFGKQADGDAWSLFYAAAGEVARMKMSTTLNHGGFGNRSLLGAPLPLGPPISHDNEMFLRKELLRERVAGGAGYVNGGRFVGGRPVCFGQSAWPPQRRQHPVNEFGLNPVSGGCGRSIPVANKVCAGTGVFLPRNYSNAFPDSKKTTVCSPTNPAAKVPQFFNKNLDHNIPQPQANIHGMFSRQHQQVPPLRHHHLKYEELAAVIMAHRQNTLMVTHQRRSSTHDVVQPEVVLPQEWTY